MLSCNDYGRAKCCLALCPRSGAKDGHRRKQRYLRERKRILLRYAEEIIGGGGGTEDPQSSWRQRIKEAEGFRDYHGGEERRLYQREKGKLLRKEESYLQSEKEAIFIDKKQNEKGRTSRSLERHRGG